MIDIPKRSDLHFHLSGTYAPVAKAASVPAATPVAPAVGSGTGQGRGDLHAQSPRLQTAAGRPGAPVPAAAADNGSLKYIELDAPRLVLQGRTSKFYCAFSTEGGAYCIPDPSAERRLLVSGGAFSGEKDGASIFQIKASELRVTSYTVAAWVKIPPDASFALASRTRRATTYTGHDEINVHADSLTFNCLGRSGKSGPLGISDGTWHHLAISCFQGAVEVYVDGRKRPGTQWDRYTATNEYVDFGSFFQVPNTCEIGMGDLTVHVPALQERDLPLLKKATENTNFAAQPQDGGVIALATPELGFGIKQVAESMPMPDGASRSHLHIRLQNHSRSACVIKAPDPADTALKNCCAFQVSLVQQCLDNSVLTECRLNKPSVTGTLKVAGATDIPCTFSLDCMPLDKAYQPLQFVLAEPTSLTLPPDATLEIALPLTAAADQPTPLSSADFWTNPACVKANDANGQPTNGLNIRQRLTFKPAP